MTRLASASFVLCAVLAGCGTPRASWFPAHQGKSPIAAAGPLDFNWTLSGERQVGPLQVFSDGTQTWMQWQPSQPIPAILAMRDVAYSVVEYRKQEPYTVIEGVYPSLMFRAGHHWARANRADFASPNSGDSPNAHVALASRSRDNNATATLSSPNTVHSSPGILSASRGQHPIDHPIPKVQVAFAVNRADLHLRQALARWANLSGWRFDPEHWSVDVDVPVSAEASFSDDFVDSVQALISSTELSDRPLQPCFYANQVLRVIPMAEACDRTLLSQEST